MFVIALYSKQKLHITEGRVYQVLKETECYYNLRNDHGNTGFYIVYIKEKEG